MVYMLLKACQAVKKLRNDEHMMPSIEVTLERIISFMGKTGQLPSKEDYYISHLIKIAEDEGKPVKLPKICSKRRGDNFQLYYVDF